MPEFVKVTGGSALSFRPLKACFSPIKFKAVDLISVGWEWPSFSDVLLHDFLERATITHVP